MSHANSQLPFGRFALRQLLEEARRCCTPPRIASQSLEFGLRLLKSHRCVFPIVLCLTQFCVEYAPILECSVESLLQRLLLGCHCVKLGFESRSLVSTRGCMWVTIFLIMTTTARDTAVASQCPDLSSEPFTCSPQARRVRLGLKAQGQWIVHAIKLSRVRQNQVAFAATGRRCR